MKKAKRGTDEGGSGPGGRARTLPSAAKVRHRFLIDGDRDRMVEFDVLVVSKEEWPGRPEAKDPAWRGTLTRAGYYVATRLTG